MTTTYVAHLKDQQQQARDLKLPKRKNKNNKRSNCDNCSDNCNDDNTKRKMSRKDDPVFNVRFVQLVEDHPCLWKSTHPGYSKKEEIQKAWQFVANETKDTVRNCRERWRTIRSSFLRSLKLLRNSTQTGRGKRKYYLSKYLQFLMPYTRTRLKGGSNLMVLRRLTTSSMGAAETSAVLAAAAVAPTSASTTSATAGVAGGINSLQPPPMTCISNMPMPYGGNPAASGSITGTTGAISGGSGATIAQNCDEHTKDSMTASVMGINENHMEETSNCSGVAAGLSNSSGSGGSCTTGFPPRLRAIKLEQGNSASGGGGGGISGREQTVEMATTMANGFLAAEHQQTIALSKTNAAAMTTQLLPLAHNHNGITHLSSKSNGIDWAELAEWMRTKNNEYHRRLIDSKNDSPTLASSALPTAIATTTSSSALSSAATISIGGSNNHNSLHHNNPLQLMAMTAAAAVGGGIPQSMHMPTLSTGGPHMHSQSQSHLQPLIPTQQQQQQLSSISTMPSDAEQMFLNSLHPFLKEMTGKQNRRFRQKVIALIDAILDDVDVS